MGDVEVDLEALICPECTDQVQPVPPTDWHVVDGRWTPVFSHLDGSPLCRTRGGVVAEPVEARWWPAQTSAQMSGVVSA